MISSRQRGRQGRAYLCSPGPERKGEGAEKGACRGFAKVGSGAGRAIG